jgi:putative phosphoribosyl transferase
MYYFPSRVVAGELLAKELTPKYRYEDCAVVALGDGAVMVAAQIAMQLHCVLTMLLTSSISLPNEIDVLAEINQQGSITYNDMYSAGELEEIKGEYFHYIEQKKMERMFEMNRLLGAGGLISNDLLRNRNIIVVSDGLNNGLSLAAAADFLKLVKIKRMIIATPFASVLAVDRMHILADEIVCFNVMEDIISIDHYYDTEHNDVPDHDLVIKTLEDVILNWK